MRKLCIGSSGQTISTRGNQHETQQKSWNKIIVNCDMKGKYKEFVSLKCEIVKESVWDGIIVKYLK